MTMLYSVADNGTRAKSQDISVWSGAFSESIEGWGRIREGARQVTILTYVGDRVVVKFPEGITGKRDDSNYQAIDKAISDALTAHYTKGA